VAPVWSGRRSGIDGQERAGRSSPARPGIARSPSCDRRDAPMTDANRCPNCGADQPDGSPEGLCPRCLMQQALDTDPPLDGTDPGGELTVSLGPGSTSGLSRIAETIGGVPRVLLRDTEATAGPAPDTEPAAPGRPGPAEPGEKYQLFGEIARGGMGAVLR